MDTTRPSLLIRIKDLGSRNAWNEFDAIYRPILFRYARSRGLEYTSAEDVVQHCMATIQKHIGSFEYGPCKGRFKSWLSVLVTNRVRDMFRRRLPKQADTGDFRVAQQREPSPEETFEKVWLDEHLKFCLARIRAEVEPQTYEAFRRHVIKDEPAERVSRDLEMTPNNLYKIKWRLTHMLREEMKALLGSEE